MSKISCVLMSMVVFVCISPISALGSGIKSCDSHSELNGTNNEKWIIETIDNTGEVGWYTDIAVVNSNSAFISYYDIGRKNLKLASSKDDVWSLEVIDSSGDVGIYSSIAVDYDGNPHISYYDKTNHDLKYAKWTGTEWNIEVVDSMGDVGLDTSIVIDSSGMPHISYHDYTNKDLKYARWTGTEWNIEVVDSIEDVGCGTSLALDALGNPHISYTRTDAKKLIYAHRLESGWSIEVVDPKCEIFGLTSIAVDSNSDPHIAYFDIGTPTDTWYVKYAYLADSKWNIEAIDPDIKHFWFDPGISIAVDQKDRIHLGYHDWKYYEMTYAWRVNNKWNIEIVDSDGVVGAYAALALDENGYPHISYMNRNDLSVKYARKIQFSPGKPDEPSGPTIGKPGQIYTYVTSSSDLDGDKIQYGWDWDDGSPIEWTEYYDNGVQVEASHSWNETGSYQIKVIAVDEHDHESEWSEPLKITISKSRAFNFNFNLLELLFERFSNLFPILQTLLLQRLGLQ